MSPGENSSRAQAPPCEAGLPKLSLAPDQVSPRFGANLVGSLFLGGRCDKKEGGAPVLFMVVKKLQEALQHWSRTSEKCSVLACMKESVVNRNL